MPAAAMVPTTANQVRNARHAARKSAGMLRELVPDSTQAGTTPATHMKVATKASGCCDGRACAIHPSAGTPSRIHQMPAEWTMNRTQDMEQSI